DLTLAYTPGVADVCRAIARDPEMVHEYTSKDNTIVVLSDGTAVLGLGDIGPAAGIPVMEGKSVLFKMLAGVDAFPLCIGTKDTDKIIEFAKNLEPCVGGINLEDISAPRCFDILKALREELSIPVFHDDQHGTAVVVLSGLINSLKIVGKPIGDVRIVVNGAGASGIAVTDLLMCAGARHVVLCDTKGAIYRGRPVGMNPYKEEIAERTNADMIKGTLADAMKGADVFLGLSVAKQVSGDMVRSMANDAVVFAMANPDPEIMPEEAKEAGARIVATGRSDYPNQINNVLGFPGLFRGALSARASDMNEPMFIAAANALASLVSDADLSEEYIISSPVDPRAMPTEARAVARAAIQTGVAQIDVDPEQVFRKTAYLREVLENRYEFFERYVREHPFRWDVI
ncbi:MAG: NAD-dependent malic enzyme, partial [Candidatus Coatesbacteria bacterium]|nr:NAD-dependent malic enzyme [Candidatus Coatesbacteria bacterium]